MYIHISEPTRKFAKHTRCEQADRDVSIPPTKPRSSRSIQDVSKLTGTLASRPPKPRSSRSIHDVSKLAGTLTSPPNPQVHEAYMT